MTFWPSRSTVYDDKNGWEKSLNWGGSSRRHFCPNCSTDQLHLQSRWANIDWEIMRLNWFTCWFARPRDYYSLERPFLARVNLAAREREIYWTRACRPCQIPLSANQSLSSHLMHRPSVSQLLLNRWLQKSIIHDVTLTRKEAIFRNEDWTASDSRTHTRA